MTRPRWIVAAVVLVGIVVAAVALARREDKPSAATATTARKTAAGRVAESLPTLERQPQAALAYDDDPPGDHRLEGQVLDDADQPVAGAAVVIDANPPREVVAEDDGSFAFDGLTPRTYQVEARRDDGVAGPVGVHLSASSEPVVLRLRAAARVIVTVTLAETGAPVTGALVELRDLAAVTAETAGDGVATLRGVGGGWHTVKVSAAGLAAVYEEVTSTGVPGSETRLAVKLKAGVTVAGVVTDGGTPVEGARVLPEGAARFTSFDPRLDGVVTDAKGRWRLAGLPRESLRFRAYHASFAPGVTPPLPLGDGVDRDDVVITLERGAKLRGRVVTAAGAPVPGAEIRVAGDDARWGLVRHAACDADGRFEMTGLPRRMTRVVALADGATSAVASVDLAAAAADLELVLAHADTIAGIVVTSSGEPVPEARVIAEPVSGDGRLEQVTSHLRGVPSAIANGDGQFVLAGLEPGAYLVRAVPPGAPTERLYVRPGVAVDAGTTDARIVLDDLASVTGKVAYADGSVPGEFFVQLGDAPARSFADAGGVFRFDDVATGKVFVRVDGPALASEALAEVVVAADTVTDLGTIVVQRGRAVSGVVVDGRGAAVPNATIAITRQLTGDGATIVPEPGPGIDQTVSGPDGRFVIRGIGGGSHVVVADHDTAGRSQAIELPAGAADTTLTLDLRPTGAVQGFVRIDGAPADAFVLLNPVTATNARFQVGTGPDGSYRFDRITPGAYLMFVGVNRGARFGGDDGTSRKIEVIAGKVVEEDVDLDLSGVTVVVRMTSPGNALQFGYGFLAAQIGDLAVMPRTVSEARAALGASGGLDTREGMIVKDRQIELAAVKPGPAMACVAVLRGDPSDPSVIAELQASLVDWPIWCRRVEVTPTPAQQLVEIAVEPLPPAQ